MRNPSIPFAQALVDAPRKGIVPRTIFYVEAMTRAPTPEPSDYAYWTGDRNYSIVMFNPRTNSNVTRTLIGMGSKLRIPDIPRVSNLTAQTIQIKLSQTDPNVNTMVRTDNVRFSYCEVHNLLLDPKTRLPVGMPEVAFIGEVDGDPIETPSAGGEGSVTLSIVSRVVRELTRVNPARRANETQSRRGDPFPDEFAKYSNTMASVSVQWGEAQ